MRGKNAVMAAFAAVFICGGAHACPADQVKIDVLPFEVRQDFTKKHRELDEMGAFNGVGMVKTNSFARVEKDGCTVTVGYRNPVLYIARELRNDQCAFNHVMEHEQEHVRIYLHALTTLEARIRSRATTEPLFDAAAAEVLAVRTEHAAHDSDDEYEKNRTACAGQIVRLALAR